MKFTPSHKINKVEQIIDSSDNCYVIQSLPCLNIDRTMIGTNTKDANSGFEISL